MSKFLSATPVLAAAVLMAASAGFAATTARTEHVATPADAGAAPFAGGVERLPGGAPNAAPWDGGVVGPIGTDPVGSAPAEALPLSKFVGSDAKAQAGHPKPGMWDFLKQGKNAGLPEPASWALVVIGFGMIGGAVRGFVVANRRLARLQPEDAE